MKRFILLATFLFIGLLNATAQKIQSPQEFLGYKLGDQFTPHYRVVEYFRYIASASKNVKLQEYGKTNEGRTLLVAFIASDDKIGRLEEIRKNNLALAGLSQISAAAQANTPAIVWLSYNVHGNESVSTEASLQTLFDLVDPANSRAKAWLKNTVVAIDPCLNPDGRERYVNFYNPVRNLVPDPSPYSREHMEPWPGGRANHYYFDLNRDWAWQSQVETQQRVALYNQWLPHVHVDFHEQGINEPYYFAPAAEPFHQDITKWQREFQTIIGKNNAKYFDEKGWMYFTRERFDLLYPSYGDTYPTYNGSIGMTYEQGGSGRAGLAVLNEEGDTLTLKDRIDHHHTTGLSTIEATSQHAAKAVSEFKNYFTSGKTDPPGEYKAYVIRSDETEKIKTLATLLGRNGIEFGYGASTGASGYNYFTGKTEKFNVTDQDIVISAFQPKSVLVKVLFEPRTFVSDSATYDITAWALPYAYGLETFATKSALKPSSATPGKTSVSNENISNPVAFVADWNSVANVKFLGQLLKENIRVRYSEIPFEINNKKFTAGSLIIARTSNENLANQFGQKINGLAAKSGVTLYPISSGFVEKGADLGSDKIRFIKKPKVALIGGDDVSSLAFGEIWHFFEQQIGYPLTVYLAADLERINWNDIDVMIFPDGNYENLASDKMQNWIKNGGKLIALEGAVAQLADKKGFALKIKEKEKTDDAKKKDTTYQSLKTYENRERDYLKNSIPGAIYKVNMDNTHPLGFGFPDFYYSLKLDDRLYQFLDNGWNVGVFKKDNYVAGFVGTETKKKIADGLVFGVEDIGSGSVVYLSDDPLFRSFWENGKLLFSNAVFMVGQ